MRAARSPSPDPPLARARIVRPRISRIALASERRAGSDLAVGEAFFLLQAGDLALASAEARWRLDLTELAAAATAVGAVLQGRVPETALATLDADAVAAEMQGSRARLEGETGRPVRHFAYPYGIAGTVGAREARTIAAPR